MAVRRTANTALIEAAREEAARLVRAVAEPRLPGDRVSRRIARAAQRLGWTAIRTEKIWRKEAHRIDSYEMDQLRREVAARAIKFP
jgi:hypothetical protein